MLVPSPSSPFWLLPVLHTVPSGLRITECPRPAEMPTAPVITRTGTSDHEPAAGFPNWPFVLSPQAYTSPFASSASEWPCPAAIAVTDVRSSSVGEGRHGVQPSNTRSSHSKCRPSCPAPCEPHAQTCPSVVSASECHCPAATESMGAPPSVTGVVRVIVVPSPSSPDWFPPIAETVPSGLTIRVSCMPVRKICKQKGCRASPRCEHPWWFDVMHDGRRCGWR